MIKNLFSRFFPNLAAFLLRASFSLFMFFGHGLDKLLHFKDKADSFPGFFGMSGQLTLAIAVFAEFLCPLMIALGYQTRLFSLPVIGTMATAALLVHADDAFAQRELSLLYLAAFTAVLLIGPGRYSIDARLNPAHNL